MSGRVVDQAAGGFRQPLVHRAGAVSLEVHGDVEEAVLPEMRRGRRRRSAGSKRRGISSRSTSIRATSSWTRTRNCRKPSRRSASSHDFHAGELLPSMGVP